MIADLRSKVFAPGSMVRARGRDWVVLPSDDADVLRLRPLGGTDDDARGLYLPLEGDDVRPATLPLPDPARAGNAVGARLLRDAVRLGFRSAAGPLRSIARLAVEPYPFQLVPLLMALRLQPVRLLIGDDVGVGKTIEAAMIARELLDRGEIRRLCVLCPPHLCEQWQQELDSKFHLPATVVRPGTVTRLERDLPLDRPLFQEYPVTVVSIDFIKGDRRRAQFIQTCPELVIVDEAHTAARGAGGNSAQQQRHSLLRELAADANRHLVLVTATPHSGDPAAFASLIGLLAPELEQAVASLDLAGGSAARQRLAHHFVQRRRGDVHAYLQATVHFPRRETQERPYRLTPDYRRLLEATRGYTRELVRESAGLTRFHQRVRWWAALALLRCVASSPAAAEAAMRTRAGQVGTLAAEDWREADRLGQDAVFDQLTRDEAEGDDATPAADTTAEEADDAPSTDRRKLLELARQARELAGERDPKLAEAEATVRRLLDDGFSPIVFCRYISTARYVGEWLKGRLGGAEVAVVTGDIPAEERADRVAALGDYPRRVLIATDCLAEGINLQQHFDAVVHYDLAWNPTRHEQREGRVDRFRQERPVVRTVLLYGQDNPVDGVVLRVLLRKTEQIRRTLGVSIPLPLDTNALLETILEALVLTDAPPQQLSLFYDEQQCRVDAVWEAAADREQVTRTVFAQHGLKPEEVAPELRETAEAAGTAADVERFVLEACSRLDVPLSADGANGASRFRLEARALPPAVRAWADVALTPARYARHPSPQGRGAGGEGLTICFRPDIRDARYLDRTHPLVEALASYTLDMALDGPSPLSPLPRERGTATNDSLRSPSPLGERVPTEGGWGVRSLAARCAAIRTTAVTVRTALLLLRARYLIERQQAGDVFPMLAEECLLRAFAGSPREPAWLPADQVPALLDAPPAANVSPQEAAYFLERVLWPDGPDGEPPAWQAALEPIVQERAAELLQAHRRVRDAARLRGVSYRVQPQGAVDVLGVYVLLPAGTAR